ncbi:hypothetical protein Tco_0976520 [Tanacetum coccineum]|uniref:Uncharacterized protein n=1 Tax=Tanacetum coccineum TaxID=301880 RepID=A0ABQ5EHT4_9ASTR
MEVELILKYFMRTSLTLWVSSIDDDTVSSLSRCQDSTTDSDYSSVGRELKHPVSHRWYCLDFSYSRSGHEERCMAIDFFHTSFCCMKYARKGPLLRPLIPIDNAFPELVNRNDSSMPARGVFNLGECALRDGMTSTGDRGVSRTALLKIWGSGGGLWLSGLGPSFVALAIGITESRGDAHPSWFKRLNTFLSSRFSRPRVRDLSGWNLVRRFIPCLEYKEFPPFLLGFSMGVFPFFQNLVWFGLSFACQRPWVKRVGLFAFSQNDRTGCLRFFVTRVKLGFALAIASYLMRVI